MDPTSDEDASVELNQSTQLGSTGTTGVNAYPKYADGTKVLSHQSCLLCVEISPACRHLLCATHFIHCPLLYAPWSV